MTRINYNTNGGDRMKIAQQRKLQLETLYSIVDELNYYEILGLSRLAHQSEIEPAFRAKTQQFHPSVLQASGLEQDAELMDRWEYVLLSFKEARDKLIDPPDRIRADLDIDTGQLRAADTELTRGLERQSAQDPAHAANSDTSKRFWVNGLQAFESGDYQTAMLQIGFALQFEPNNEVFKEWLAKAKEENKKAPKQNLNPYKLRL